MSSHYAWSIILITGVCGVPVAAALFLDLSGTRPWRHLCFAGAAAIAGLWPAWGYITWHGRYNGWRPAEILEFTEALLVISLVTSAFHGAFAWWLAARLAPVSSPRTGARWRRPSTRSAKPWFVVHAGRLGTVCGAAIGLWLGWLASDIASHPGPENFARDDVIRRCALVFGSESTLNPLASSRFFLLLGFTVVGSFVGRFVVLRKVSNAEIARKA